MNKRTKFHFQKVIKLFKNFLNNWCFIGFLCFVASVTAQNPEGVLDYAEENILPNPNEVIEISDRFLQGTTPPKEKQCKAYLLKAKAHIFLQQYDEAIDDVFKIKDQYCELEEQDLFELLLIEKQIYFLLDLKDYQREAAERLAVFFEKTNPNQKKENQYKLIEEFNSLKTALKKGKTINTVDFPKIKKEEFTEEPFFAGVYLFLQSFITQNENQEIDFKQNLEEEIKLSKQDFEKFYYRYFALYDAQKKLSENKKEEAYKLLKVTLKHVKEVEGLSYYKRDIYTALITFGIEEEKKDLVLTNRTAELTYSSEVDMSLTKALTKIFAYKTDLNIKKQSVIGAKQKTGLRVIWFAGSGVVILLVVYIFRLKWLEKHYAKIAEIIKKLNAEKANVKKKATKTKKKQQQPSKSLVSKEVEEQILSGLENFEKEEMFLHKDISLAYLASKLKMNTKYLSEVLNSRLNENFNGYINRLRIEYIVNKLKNDPQYLKYKISYLAEISGYSSHSSFSTAFKSITGMPPTKFISYLKRKI